LILEKYAFIFYIICILLLQSNTQASTVNIRIPSWTSLDTLKASLNSQKFVPALQGIFPFIFLLFLHAERLLQFNIYRCLNNNNFVYQHKNIGNNITSYRISNICIYFFIVIFTGNFLSITKNWGSNDNLVLEFPISIHTEQIKGIITSFTIYRYNHTKHKDLLCYAYVHITMLNDC
jgi:hypothetical protein